MVIAALSTALLALGAWGGTQPSAEPLCPLVPRPKVYRDSGRAIPLAGKAVALVVGDQATPPEKLAAATLASDLRKRFGIVASVHGESGVRESDGLIVLLGQRATCRLLDEACRDRQINLSADSPGHDGFVIEVFEEARRPVGIVGGSDARGVLYGQHALLDLVRVEAGEPSLPVVSLRDWPSIPWRGRPYTSVATHLEPGVLDAYLSAGLNFLDVRKGAFGYGPDEELDREEIARCLREAHRRGLFVFGTVSCGIKPEKFDGALRVFRELIELGVDGLWISFDDPGGGSGTTELARRAVELGREHGMTGRAIATTPPSGSYQVIDTQFNREMIQVPGMAQATWFFTRNPCRADLEAARRLGIEGFPAWWHNWPRTDAGFTHGSYGGTSFRADGKPPYMEVPPLTSGWHSPKYEDLRDAAGNTDTVMMWGGWQPEYTCAVLGTWAWAPETHDFQRTRRAIYETVYGAANVEGMMRFDDALRELKGHFLLPERSADPTKNFPPRLRPDADRERVRALIAEMEGLCNDIAATAPRESLLEEERLRALFLEPMKAELATGKALAGLERPEDWWPAHEAAVMARLAAGDPAGVEQLSAEIRPKLEAQLAALLAAVGDLKGMDAYEKLWRERAAGGVAYWEKELECRADAFEKALADREKAGLDVPGMLARLADPPAEGKLLATVTPEQLARSPVTCTGAWSTGLYTRANPRAFVLSFPGHTASKPGELCQVAFSIPVPEFRGKLHLQLHLTDEYDSDRWTGYRFYQLLHGDTVVWEEDIALTRRGGGEWTSLDVTALARGRDRLDLTLRLLDKRSVGNYTTTIFLGPVRLVDVP